MGEEANENYKEIFKLDAMLTNADIPHVIKRRFDGWQIRYPNENEWVCSVVEFSGSYGYEVDLLELAGRGGVPVIGHLSAIDAYEYIDQLHFGVEW